MQRKNYKAYFTVEAAVLDPIVLGVIVLMTYLLFFQYDRCLLEQDMGRAAVRSGSRWMQKKEELNRQLQEKDMFFDTEKNPVEILRNSQRYRGKTEETTESDNKENTSGAVQ